MESCPCGLGKEYAVCCEPVIKGERSAETAEELMRSRYCAYVKTEVDHILNSVHPNKQSENDERSVRSWSKGSDWLGLEIIETVNGSADDDEGTVEFKATYRKKGEKQVHHEVASFKKENGKWFFFDAESPMIEQVVRTTPKIGRNDPCPCGSNKKYKKCCGQ